MSWGNDEIDALTDLQRLNEADDVECVKAIFSEFVERYALGPWAIMQFANPASIPLEQRLVITSWPSDYAMFRRQRPNELHDPIIRAANRSHKPFTWAQAYATADKKGRSMMDAARDFGLDDGLVFPIKSIDALPGGVSIAGNTKGLSPRHIRMLNLASIHAYDRLENLIGPSSFIIESELSPREVEVLSYAAAGMTSNDIGEALCLSSRTVEHYCQSARSRLGSRNLVHTVSRAIAQGLILA